MKDYDKWEAECKTIRVANGELLEGFETWLTAAGLKDATIERHVSNAAFYINDFLLYSEAVPAREGASEIAEFLGYWFIRKAMWANQAQIKSNAASLKKFYTFLYEKGLVEKAELADMKATIKEWMPEWLTTMRRYDDPSVTDMEEVWGL